MIRIVVAIDNSFLRSTMVSTLEDTSDFLVVAAVGTAVEVVIACRVLQPDALMLDVPCGQVRAVRQIRAACPRTKVLALVSEQSEVAGLTVAGAAACFSKETSREELIVVIRAACDRMDNDRSGQGGLAISRDE